MMEKDDCFTPYQSDGETPRFKKPIVTYWVLMSGCKLFGVSPFGSRFFFWIAGALLVAVSYFMANSLMKNKRVAELTAFVVASNPLVLMSASRSITDILLVLFLTVSAWGFLEIVVRENPSKKFYWMAYLGSALAFETKGIPAAAFAGVSMLFLLLNPWKRIAFKKLLEPVSMVVSIGVALSWFVLMFLVHGSGYLDAFFADQVGDRVSSKVVQVLGNGVLGIVNLVMFLIPWVILSFSKPKELRSSIRKGDTNLKVILGFVGTWILLIVLMAASVFKFYDRYVLPVIPLLAMGLAYSLIHSKTRFQKPILNVFIALNLFVLLIAVWYLLFVAFHAILFMGAVVCGVLFSLYFGGFLKRISKEILIANGLLLLYFSVHVLMYPILTPVPAKQLSVELEKLLKNDQEEVYVYGHVGIPANVRVQSRGQLNIVSMDTVYTLPENPNHLIVFRESEANRLNLENYDIFPGSKTFAEVPLEEMPLFLRKLIVDLQTKGKKYCIGRLKE
jgi:4-amino-4-deoxy-L-arabinose transferase-like glycosyltransferase